MDEEEVSLTQADKETKERNVGNNDSIINPDFCLSEFARLLVLVHDDDHCLHATERAMLAEMGKPALTGNITRDAYWSIVSDRFNDRSVAAALPVRKGP